MIIGENSETSAFREFQSRSLDFCEIGGSLLLEFAFRVGIFIFVENSLSAEIFSSNFVFVVFRISLFKRDENGRSSLLECFYAKFRILRIFIDEPFFDERVDFAAQNVDLWIINFEIISWKKMETVISADSNKSAILGNLSAKKDWWTGTCNKIIPKAQNLDRFLWPSFFKGRFSVREVEEG